MRYETDNRRRKKNRITSKNKKAFKKKMILKKIMVYGLTTVGLISALKNFSEPKNIINPDEIVLDLDEEYLREDLQNYYNAKLEYQRGEITKQDFIKKCRDLSDDALDFLKEEVREETNVSKDNFIKLTRKGTVPEDNIAIYDENGNIKLLYNGIPSKIAPAFNNIISQQGWEGSGENWDDDDVKKFTRETDIIYNDIIKLTENDKPLKLGKPEIDNREIETGTKTR